MMQLNLKIGNKNFRINPSGSDISIPLQFNGPQPNTYGVDPAKARAYETGDFVGDVRRGGSCNFEEYTLVPHCNGTHTECIGHISEERISIVNELHESFIASTLVSLELMSGTECNEEYAVPYNPEDRVITESALKKVLSGSDSDFLNALIIRTLPNDAGKKSRDYMKESPAFFTLPAMRYIRSLGVNHLLTDLPSVDRLFDEGKLNAHRIYWEVPFGEKNITTKKHSSATITEMIFVPDGIADGIYLLNLQIAPFLADASPSRPLLFSIQSES